MTTFCPPTFDGRVGVYERLTQKREHSQSQD